MTFSVKSTNKSMTDELKRKIDTKTKPLGSLGMLERIALQVGLIQQSLSPRLTKPTIVVFAGDHGITQESVSAYPKEVTYQMVLNFLRGGAAINVFARQHGITLSVVNAGVDHDFEATSGLIDIAIAKGTANFLHGDAMTAEQCQQAITRGADIVRTIYKGGTNVIGFGEMGIGNTSAAAMIMSAICEIPLKQCVGRGTGLTDEQLQQKIAVLEKAQVFHKPVREPLEVLAAYGGFEIAMIAGAYMQAAALGMTIIVDGFITTSALLAAHKLEPSILDYCIFSHVSDESGHAAMLAYLRTEPLLFLHLDAGEGTGAALVYPLLVSSVAFLNEMASFDAAHVSERQS